MMGKYSSLLAEILMVDIEDRIHYYSLIKGFVYWYVNDFIACFTGTYRQLSKFVDQIHTLS